MDALQINFFEGYGSIQNMYAKKPYTGDVVLKNITIFDKDYYGQTKTVQAKAEKVVIGVESNNTEVNIGLPGSSVNINSPAGSLILHDTPSSTFKFENPPLCYALMIEHDGIVKMIVCDPLKDIIDRYGSKPQEVAVNNPVQVFIDQLINPVDDILTQFDQLQEVLNVGDEVFNELVDTIQQMDNIPINNGEENDPANSGIVGGVGDIQIDSNIGSIDSNLINIEDIGQGKIEVTVMSRGKPYTRAEVGICDPENRSWITHCSYNRDTDKYETEIKAGNYHLVIKPRTPGFEPIWYENIKIGNGATVQKEVKLEIGKVKMAITALNKSYERAEVGICDSENRQWLAHCKYNKETGKYESDVKAGTYHLAVKPRTPGFGTIWFNDIVIRDQQITEDKLNLKIGTLRIRPSSGKKVIEKADVMIYKAESREFVIFARWNAGVNAYEAEIAEGVYDVEINTRIPGMKPFWVRGIIVIEGKIGPNK